MASERGLLWAGRISTQFQQHILGIDGLAGAHGIAETAVKIHGQHILCKLDVSSRVHAAVMVTERGLV